MTVGFPVPEGAKLSIWKGWIVPSGYVDPMAIARGVAAQYGLTMTELRTSSHLSRLSHPRQELMWRLRAEKKPDGSHRFSLSWIARFLGLKHHSAVIFGCERHGLRMSMVKAYDPLADYDSRDAEGRRRSSQAPQDR